MSSLCPLLRSIDNQDQRWLSLEIPNTEQYYVYMEYILVSIVFAKTLPITVKLVESLNNLLDLPEFIMCEVFGETGRCSD